MAHRDVDIAEHRVGPLQVFQRQLGVQQSLVGGIVGKPGFHRLHRLHRQFEFIGHFPEAFVASDCSTAYPPDNGFHAVANSLLRGTQRGGLLGYHRITQLLGIPDQLESGDHQLFLLLGKLLLRLHISLRTTTAATAPTGLLTRFEKVVTERPDFKKEDIAGDPPLLPLRTQFMGLDVIGNEVAGIERQLFQVKHVLQLSIPA